MRAPRLYRWRWRTYVAELIELQVNSDPRRGESEFHPLSPVTVSPGLLLLLRQQKLTLESIPQSGLEVIIKRYDNLSEDVTDRVHPEVAHRVALAARTIGLDIAGVDLVIEDISRPIEEQRGAIVEVNAGPGLLMHLTPSVGEPRPVGEYIINHIFGPSENARIPIACVAGSHGKTSTSRMLFQFMQHFGSGVAVADGNGTSIGDWQVTGSPSDDARGARDVLANPDVTAAVFEASIESMLREGLGFDKCDVAIITNLAQSDLGGEFDLWSEEKLFAVARTPVDVVLETGAAVLNANDSQVMQMKPLSKGKVILFSQQNEPSQPTQPDALTQHLSDGGQAVVYEHDQVWLCTGADKECLTKVATSNQRSEFQVENLLAAIAAAWHLGVPKSSIASVSQTLLK